MRNVTLAVSHLVLCAACAVLGNGIAFGQENVLPSKAPALPVVTYSVVEFRVPTSTVVKVAPVRARAAMTYEQKLDLHDALHEGDGIDRPGHWTFPGNIDDHLRNHPDNRATAIRSRSTTVTRSLSSCPGGNCPTSRTNSYQRGFYSSGTGWWFGRRW